GMGRRRPIDHLTCTHMHDSLPARMRTTIELDPRQRASLLRLAAERGEKGFSRLIAEAIDAYLANLGLDDRQAARKLRGILSEEDASGLEDRVKAIREQWR